MLTVDQFLDKHIDRLDWCYASKNQPWSWLQKYQNRIQCIWASANPTIPPEVLDQHLDKLSWWDISQNNFAHHRAIEKLLIVRKHIQSFHLPRWWKLSRLIKTRQFCEWYYHPDNIGGKIAKRRIAGIFEEN